MIKPFACLSIVLVSLTLSAVPSVAMDIVATPKFTKAAPEVKTTVIERIFARRYAKTLAVLAKDFPDDHKLLSERIAEIDASTATQQVKLVAAFAALSDIREKYSSQVIYAPDTALERIVGLLGEFHLAVLKDEGPKVCGTFATKGSIALFTQDLSELYAARLDAQGEAYFSAVVEAIENPAFHDKLKPADWTNVSGILVAAGGTMADIQTIAAARPDDPELCVAMGRLMLFITKIKSPESERVRAEFAKNSIGY